MKNSDKQHILIVEDSVDMQILLAQLLTGEGYEVTRAFNGKEALETLKTMPKLPAFILLDIMMPVMSGIEFRQEQLKDPRIAGVPVVIMTADSNPQAKVRDLPIELILKKPVSLEQLLDVVEKYAGAAS